MIYVHFECKNGNDYYGLTIEGHAGYSDNGNDIVCAGASAIAYTLLGYLNNLEIDTLNYRDCSGDFYVNCVTDDERVETAFEMAEIGFLQLENTYPQCVRVRKN